MTNEEFKQARADLGLTQPQLARILGTSLQTIQNYDAGRRSVHPTVAHVMGWLAKGFRPPGWPRGRA